MASSIGPQHRQRTVWGLLCFYPIPEGRMARRRKTALIVFRTNPTTATLIRNRASEAGQSVSQWLRGLAISHLVVDGRVQSDGAAPQDAAA